MLSSLVNSHPRGPKPPLNFVNENKRQKVVIPLKVSESTILGPKFDPKTVFCDLRNYTYTWRVPKCKTIKIQQGFCYGLCHSLYIPGNTLHYSTACLPKYKLVPVTLKCRVDGRRVRKIKFYHKAISCACTKMQIDMKQLLRELTKYNGS